MLLEYPRKQKGFTLVELLIVIGIIGLLSAVAIPIYLHAIAEVKLAEGPILLSDFTNLEVKFYLTDREVENWRENWFLGFPDRYDDEGELARIPGNTKQTPHSNAFNLLEFSPGPTYFVFSAWSGQLPRAFNIDEAFSPQQTFSLFPDPSQPGSFSGGYSEDRYPFDVGVFAQVTSDPTQTKGYFTSLSVSSDGTPFVSSMLELDFNWADYMQWLNGW